MRIKFLQLSLLLLSAAGLASCGGNGGQPLSTTSIPTVMSKLGTSMLGKMPTGDTLPTLPFTGATLTSAVHIRAADCETSTTPDPTTDADSDGIALLKKTTFDCNAQTFGSFTLTRHGSYTVQDLDDTKQKLLGGMNVEYAIDKFNYVDNSNNETLDNSYSGFWKYVPNGAGGVTSTASFSGHTRSTTPTLNFAVDFEYGYTWNWKQTPTDSANPWSAGTLAIDGTFRMSGTFSEESSGVQKAMTGTYVIRHYSANLQYDQTCSKFYRSGSIYFDDYNNTVLEIRYACSTASFYVNGVSSNLYTP